MKNKTKSRQTQRAIRHNRIRARVMGTSMRPRLSVFRSNRFLYAQLVNDETGTTLATVDTRSTGSGSGSVKPVVEKGAELAKKALAAGINKVVFDRGGFSYRGTIAIFADSVRAGGIEF